MKRPDLWELFPRHRANNQTLRANPRNEYDRLVLELRFGSEVLRQNEIAGQRALRVAGESAVPQDGGKHVNTRGYFFSLIFEVTLVTPSVLRAAPIAWPTCSADIASPVRTTSVSRSISTSRSLMEAAWAETLVFTFSFNLDLSTLPVGAPAVDLVRTIARLARRSASRSWDERRHSVIWAERLSPAVLSASPVRFAARSIEFAAERPASATASALRVAARSISVAVLAVGGVVVVVGVVTTVSVRVVSVEAVRVERPQPAVSASPVTSVVNKIVFFIEKRVTRRLTALFRVGSPRILAGVVRTA